MAKESGVHSEGNLLNCIEVRDGGRTHGEGEEGAGMCDGERLRQERSNRIRFKGNKEMHEKSPDQPYVQ